jgi:hypothetical protein
MADNYSILKNAIENRLTISAVYQAKQRELCPHALGLSKKGVVHCFFFQFAGGSSQPLPPGGEWRCIPIDGLEIINTYAGEWHSGDNYDLSQTCIESVQVNV